MERKFGDAFDPAISDQQEIVAASLREKIKQTGWGS